jgi:hypothetical protein
LNLPFEDEQLALTSNAIDRRFARLERKFRSMQQLNITRVGGRPQDSLPLAFI